ncbi:MAG: hypothetical protein DRN20_02270 [Thermoplasmata archaeon]|nr:MAG: hypothetical protein DRN20_02270 [Thermoplasmata archaeon]
MPTLRLYARYPFMKGAVEYIRGLGVELEDVISDIAFEAVRSRGRQRVVNALQMGDIGEVSLVTEYEKKVELLSYPVARMIVSAVGDYYLIRKYALAEATRMERRMYEDYEEYKKAGRRRASNFLILMAESLGVDCLAAGDDFSLHICDYLTMATPLHAMEYKLVHQRVQKGRVIVNARRLIRLFRERITRMIEEQLPLPMDNDIAEALSPYIWEVMDILDDTKDKSFVSDIDTEHVEFECFPPCMKEIMASIERGENVPHMGRFSLTAFLHYIGMSNEEILKIFARSSDFADRIARYQIDHITGKISGKEYLPPECNTMRTYGLCNGGDDLCKKEWMHHPLIYYRACTKRRKK